MSQFKTIVTLIAWFNFSLAIAGLIKFLPLIYLLSLSALGMPPDLGYEVAGAANSDHQSHYAWSLDLISDTPLIMLVWMLVLWTLRKLCGRTMILPWRKT